MKSLFALIIWFLITATSFGQDIGDLKTVILPQKGNVYMTCIVGNELTTSFEPQIIQKALNNNVSDDDQQKLFDKITAENQKTFNNYKIASNIIDLNGEILKYATSYIPVAGKMAGYGIDKLDDFLIDKSKESVKLDLESRLKLYQDTKGNDDYSKLVASYDPEHPQVFLDNLNNLSNPIAKNYLKDVPEEEQPIVEHFYATQTINILKGGFTALSISASAQAEALKQAQNNINVLGRAFYEGTKHNQETMNGIIAMQQDIQSDVQNLQGSLDEFKDQTNNNFQFVFDFMYSRMSVPERKAAIEQGMLDRKLTDAQKEQELNRLAILDKQEKLEATVNDMIVGGSEVLNIAKNLKLLDPKILGTANTILQVATIGQTAFKSFSSGNYLAAISSVSDLFGLGGPDVAAQRQAQIMKSFDMVFARLDVMDKKLDVLIQGQEQILKNQQTIYKTLVDFSLQVSKNQVEVMDELRKIHGDILIDRKFIIDNILKQYSNCSYFAPPIYSGTIDPPIVQTNKQVFPSLTTFREWWATYKDNCVQCASRFATVHSGGDQNEYDPIFTTDNNTDLSKNDAKLELDTVYQNSLELLSLNLTPFPKLKDNVDNISPFYPIQNINDWDSKIDILDSLSSPLGDFRLRNYVLEPNIVSLHIRYLLNFHVYYMLINPFDNDNPYTYDQFIKQKIISKAGLKALNESVGLLNQAIAQQNLLSGDILIPIISKIFQDRDTSDKLKEAAFQLAVRLLSENTLLARNFLVYEFKKELQLNGDNNFLAYRISLSMANRYDDTVGLQNLMTFKWQFRYSPDTVKNEIGTNVIQPKGISIAIGDKFFPPPLFEDIVSGAIEHTPDFVNLIPLRQELFRELSSYNVYLKCTPQEIISLNSMLLHQ